MVGPVRDPAVGTPGADDYLAAGLYDPRSPEAADRLALLTFLSDKGASMADLVEAHATGSLTSLASELALRGPGPRLTPEEVAARSGTTVDRVLGVRRATGLPGHAGAAELPATVVDDMAAFDAGAELFGEAPTLAFTRVMGAAIAKVADAAVSLFFTERRADLTRQPGGVDLARAGEEATATFMAAVPTVLVNALREHMGRAVARSASERIPAVDTRAVTVGIGFVDLVGSTAWSGHLTLEEHARALTAFESAAWDATARHGGRVVKLIGDEAMFVAPSGLEAVRIAVELCRVVAGAAELPEARGAVGFGTLGTREGDYFGPLVNLVSRALPVAGPSTVVVIDSLRSDVMAAPEVDEGAARTAGGRAWEVVDLDPRELRGIDEPVALFALR